MSALDTSPGRDGSPLSNPLPELLLTAVDDVVDV